MFDGKHDKNGYNFKLMTFQYIYIYIQRERERERDLDDKLQTKVQIANYISLLSPPKKKNANYTEYLDLE